MTFTKEEALEAVAEIQAIVELMLEIRKEPMTERKKYADRLSYLKKEIIKFRKENPDA